MSPFVIVIGRQYGAGGRSLGKKLAEILEIPYYDKELLSESADALGFSKELFMKADEKKPSLFRSFLSFNYGSPSAAFSSYVISDDRGKGIVYHSRAHSRLCAPTSSRAYQRICSCSDRTSRQKYP